MTNDRRGLVRITALLVILAMVGFFYYLSTTREKEAGTAKQDAGTAEKKAETAEDRAETAEERADAYAGAVAYVIAECDKKTNMARLLREGGFCRRAEQAPIVLPGRAGNAGLDGKDGRTGRPGRDGRPGTPGVDGAAGLDGKDGAPGVDGVPGVDGKDGAPGVDGKDGAAGQSAFPFTFRIVIPGDGITPARTYLCNVTTPEAVNDCEEEQP